MYRQFQRQKGLSDQQNISVLYAVLQTGSLLHTLSGQWDHAVSQDFPLDLKKKAVPNLFLRESVEQVWFREISVLRGIALSKTYRHCLYVWC